MENKLLNEIENFRLLFNYNTKKTLNENLLLIEDTKYFLNEGFFILAESLLPNILKNYSDDAIKLLSKELKDLSMFSKVGAEGAETFLKRLRQGNVAGKQLGEFSTELLKNSKFAGGQASALLDGAAEAYVKNMAKSTDDAVLRFRNAQPLDRAQMLRDRGYSEQAIKKINKKYDDLLQGKLGPKPEPVPSTVQDRLKDYKQKKNIAGTTDDVAKQADGAVPKVPETPAAKANRLQRAKDAITKYKNQLVSSLKTKGWKKTLAIATGLGIGGALLWQLAKDNGVQTEDLPTEQPQDTGGGSVVTGSGTQFRANEEFPLMFMDSGEKVKQLQTSLGVKNRAGQPNITGKFYTATEALVKPKAQELGVTYTRETGVSEDLFNKIVGSSSTEEIVDRPNRELQQAVTTDRKKVDLNVPTRIPNLGGPNVNAIQTPTTELNLEQQFQMAKINLDKAKAELDAAQATNDRAKIGAARGKQQAARKEVQRLRNELYPQQQ